MMNLNQMLPYHNIMFVRMGSEESNPLLLEWIATLIRQSTDIPVLHIPSSCIALMENNVYKLHSDAYTMDRSKVEYYNAVKSMQGQMDDKHVIISGLNTFIEYCRRWRTMQYAQQFIKSILIKEISAERKIITYRSVEEVTAFIQSIANTIQPDIIIKCNQQIRIGIGIQPQPQTSCNATHAFIIEVQDMKFIKVLINGNRDKINRQRCRQMTEKHTIPYLMQLARGDMLRMANALSHTHIDSSSLEVKQFPSCITQCAIINRIFKYALHLYAQQQQIIREFNIFVLEMRAKYSLQIQKYIASLLEEIKYQQRKQQYHIREMHSSNTNMHSKTINKYIYGFRQWGDHRIKEGQMRKGRIMYVQSAMRRWLYLRRAVNAYLTAKMEAIDNKNASMRDLALKINELEESKFNQLSNRQSKLKACIAIMEIKSPTGFWNANEVIHSWARCSNHCVVKIVAEEASLRILTIQGKLITAGVPISPQLAYSGKSNTNPNDYKENSNRHNSYSNKENFFQNMNRTQSNRIQSVRESLKGSASSTAFSSKSMISSLKQHAEKSLRFPGMLPGVQIIASSTFADHTVCLSLDRNMYHFGAGHPLFPSALSPTLVDTKFMQPTGDKILQLLLTQDNLYILTSSYHIYSYATKAFIRNTLIQTARNLKNARLMHTHSPNISIVYFIAYNCDCQDKARSKLIQKYILNNQIHLKDTEESFLL